MSKRIVTFGEIMLRLKNIGSERLMQSPMLEATFGGGEANVAVSLANYGMDASFVTILPDNDVTAACIRELRGIGVDTRDIVFKPGRIGIYFLESGAVQRPSKVIYDRAYSSISLGKTGDIDWDKCFKGATWFHITGITPAISEGSCELAIESVKAAKRLGLTVSAAYSSEPERVMEALHRAVDRCQPLEGTPVVVEIQDFGDSAIAYDVALWIPASEFLSRRWRLRRCIWEEFREAGVEMTYPHLNVHLDHAEQKPGNGAPDLRRCTVSKLSDNESQKP